MHPFLRGLLGGAYALSAYLVSQRVDAVLKDIPYADLLKGDEEGRWVADTFIAKTQTKSSVYGKGQYPDEIQRGSDVALR